MFIENRQFNFRTKFQKRYFNKPVIFLVLTLPSYQTYVSKRVHFLPQKMVSVFQPTGVPSMTRKGKKLSLSTAIQDIVWNGRLLDFAKRQFSRFIDEFWKQGDLETRQLTWIIKLPRNMQKITNRLIFYLLKFVSLCFASGTGVDAGERRKSDGRERQVFFLPLWQRASSFF